MKIGIVTFSRCDNYGAELQAYALQKKLNDLGYDAEVLDLEMQKKKLASTRVIVKAIINRYKQFGLWKGTGKVIRLIVDKYALRQSTKRNQDKIVEKHKLFTSFFNDFTRHSNRYYSLSDVYTADMPYDIYIAGSDQIWNYMQTDYLDVYFLMFANRFHARKISYAASFSVPYIPDDLKRKYKKLIENLDFISVRELDGQRIVEECSRRKAEVVLDPTLLLDKKEWIENVGVAGEYANKRYVLVYTLSGSRYIYYLAKSVASQLGVEVINIKSNFCRTKGDEGITHLYNVGPREFVSLFEHAAYVITDSFHGTAFSINFNIPFTTLLNPSSNMNSRALSILKITRLENRLIYDNGENLLPNDLHVNYTKVNRIIEEWREKSLNYLNTVLT